MYNKTKEQKWMAVPFITYWAAGLNAIYRSVINASGQIASYQPSLRESSFSCFKSEARYYVP